MPKKYIPKLLAQEQIDRLRGSARENAQRNRGETVDEELKLLLPVLREHGKDFPELEHGERLVGTVTFSYTVNDWFKAGEIILRNEAYGKPPKDLADEEELYEEEGKPFEERLYAELFLDALAAEFASRAKQFHLTPELVQFVIRVLEAALNHGRKLPAVAFQQKEELTQYLTELKQSGDTYREPPVPIRLKGKPGPKPKLKVLEHAGPNAYITYVDPDSVNT
jgi:hypothetical protein